MKRILSIAAIIIMTAIGCGAQQNNGFESLGADAFQKAIASENVVLVDVRTDSEWNEGHLAGAILIDVQQSSFLDKASETLPKDKTIAVYCRSGRRSKTAAGILSDAGYKVIDLDNGYAGWTAAGKPVVTSQD